MFCRILVVCLALVLIASGAYAGDLFTPPAFPPDQNPGLITRELKNLSPEELQQLVVVCLVVVAHPELYTPLKIAICQLATSAGVGTAR